MNNNEHITEKKYWKVADLAGSKVFEESGEYLGELIDVLPTNSNDIWVVKTTLNPTGELLIPALKSVIKDVNLEAKKITVALPDGLKEVFEEHGQKPGQE